MDRAAAAGSAPYEVRSAASAGQRDRHGFPLARAVVPALPAGDLGDRPERLERAAQERRPLPLRIEQRLRLGRWLARRQRHVDGEDRRAIRGRREQRRGDLVGGRHLGRQRAVREVVDEHEDVVGG